MRKMCKHVSILKGCTSECQLLLKGCVTTGPSPSKLALASARSTPFDPLAPTPAPPLSLFDKAFFTLVVVALVAFVCGLLLLVSINVAVVSRRFVGEEEEGEGEGEVDVALDFEVVLTRAFLLLLLPLLSLLLLLCASLA